MITPLWLPTLDKFFGIRFLKLICLCAAGTFVLVIIGDLLMQAEDLTEYAKENQLSWQSLAIIVLNYYLCYAPRLMIQFMFALTLVIACAIQATIAAQNNEFTVLRSSGVSMQRSMLIVALLAFLIAITLMLTRDMFMPAIIKKEYTLAQQIKPTQNRSLKVVLRDPRTNTRHVAAMAQFSILTNEAFNIRIEQFSYDSQGNMTDVISRDADRAFLQPWYSPNDHREYAWQTPEPYEWSEVADKELTREKKIFRASIPTEITPAILERNALGDAILTRRDLNILGDETDALIEKHRRYAEPFSIFGLIMCVLAILLRHTVLAGEPSYVRNISLAVAICAIYHLFTEAFIALGQRELKLFPVPLAAWTPAFLLMTAGVILFKRLER